jgi:hypothetical protein
MDLHDNKIKRKVYIFSSNYYRIDNVLLKTSNCDNISLQSIKKLTISLNTSEKTNITLNICQQDKNNPINLKYIYIYLQKQFFFSKFPLPFLFF